MTEVSGIIVVDKVVVLVIEARRKEAVGIGAVGVRCKVLRCGKTVYKGNVELHVYFGAETQLQEERVLWNRGSGRRQISLSRGQCHRGGGCQPLSVVMSGRLVVISITKPSSRSHQLDHPESRHPSEQVAHPPRPRWYNTSLHPPPPNQSILNVMADVRVTRERKKWSR